MQLKSIKIGAGTDFLKKIYSNVIFMCGNISATMYINTTDGIKSDCCKKIACNIWEFCIRKKYEY